MSFYQMHRGWMDSPIFRNAEYSERDAWVWLVENAAWKKHRVYVKGAMVDLSRGQLAATIRDMAAKWKWHRNRVDRFLKRLESDAMIGTATGTGVHVITICKYEQYQASRDTIGTPIGTPIGTAAGQQRDTIEEGKEGNNSSVSEDTDAAASEVVDFTKAVFDLGRTYLTASGVSAKQAGGLVGKWRKQLANDTELIDIFKAAQREGVTEPVPWITKAVEARAKPDEIVPGYVIEKWERDLYAGLH